MSAEKTPSAQGFTSLPDIAKISHSRSERDCLCTTCWIWNTFCLAAERGQCARLSPLGWVVGTREYPLMVTTSSESRDLGFTVKEINPLGT